MSIPSRPPSIPKTAESARKAVVKAAKTTTKATKAAARGRKPARSTRPRAAHLGPERRRPMILDAAFSVFLERGYEGASMEEIARRAGVSKPVVYSSFPGKEALFGELLRREEQRILDAIATAVPAELETDDLEGLIADTMTAFLQAVIEAPESFQVVFLGAGGADAAVTRRIQRGREAQIDTIAGLAENWLKAQGVPDPEKNGRLQGYLFVGLAENAARALVAEPERWTPREMAEQIARLFMRGRGGLELPTGGAAAA